MKHFWKQSNKRINGLIIKFCVNCGSLKIAEPNWRETYFKTYYLIDDLPFDKVPDCNPKKIISSFTETIKNTFMIRFKFTLDNFLTPEECKAFIKRSEDIGYEESKIRVGNTEEMNKDVRDNYRVVFDDKELADSLFERVKEYLPQELDENKEWKLLNLNERFRFYRYENGQQFKQHKDGSFVRNDNEVSKVTLMMYLNDDFKGGATRFVLENEYVEPKEGKLLLFRHGLLHAGCPVFTGVKYVLRTDVMYVKNETTTV